MSIWVQPQDVVNRWTGDDAPAVNDALLKTLVDDSEVLLDARFSNITERLANGSLKIGVLKIVVSAMVQRAYNAEPTNKTSYSYTSGPFSEQGSYSGGSGESGLYLTQQEIQLLAPKGSLSRAFSVNMDTGHANFPVIPPSVVRSENWGGYFGY